MALERKMAAGHDDVGGRAGHATFRQDTLSVDDESAHPDVAITTPRGAAQSGDTKKTNTTAQEVVPSGQTVGRVLRTAASR